MEELSIKCPDSTCTEKHNMDRLKKFIYSTSFDEESNPLA
jgi:hypothetical protein